MRTFIVLCFVAITAADQLPYNYAPVGHADFNYGRGEAQLSGPTFDGSHDASGGSVGGVDAGLNKEFYTFTANDDEFEQPDASEQIANSLKKNLQVIFIKGPENRGLENAALNLAKHASEQRTAIYVLNKQADIGSLANKLSSDYSHSQNKPEVHFVKYRTPEDAQNAQRSIQSQYDQLGGSSQNYNGGVAPVLDYASKGQIGGGQSAQAGGLIGDAGAANAPAPSSTYLPANFFRF